MLHYFAFLETAVKQKVGSSITNLNELKGTDCYAFVTHAILPKTLVHPIIEGKCVITAICNVAIYHCERTY